MTGLSDVGVIGVEIRPDIPDARQSLEEILHGVVQAALRDAGVGIESIDGIVVASNDQYDGRAISIMAASGSVGGVDRDILSTPSAGEHAFVMGALRVASGLYRTQLVAAWSPLETDALHEVQRLAADPYYHRRLPLDELASHALQASAVEAKRGGRDAAVALAARTVAAHARAAPAGPPPPWPLPPELAVAPTNGAVALVLASKDFAAERGIEDAAWIRGLGWATEPSYLGDRDLARLPSLDAAAARAYRAAGIERPLDDLDVAEIACLTPHQTLLAYEALGFSAPSRWLEDETSGAFGRDGRLPVNPSGGLQAGNPVFCAGLVSIAEIANQVRKRAGGRQVSPARIGLAHAASGFAMQYNTVAVLADVREAVQ